MITTPFPIVHFDRLFEPVNRTFALSDLDEYSCVGVRLEGRGAYVREQRLGVEIKRKKQSLVQDGDVLYNKLFAWRGTFAIAGKSVHGCIASDKFPLYRMDSGKLDPSYLGYWFRSRHLALQARQHSRGAAALSKLTLNPPEFWKLWIPLPDLPDQRRIAKILEASFTSFDRIAQLRQPIDAVVQGRRAGVGSEARLLMTAALERMNNRFRANLDTLDKALTLRPRSGPSFPCMNEGPGVAVIMPSALGGYRYDKTKEMYGNGTEQLGIEDILHAGDLLISRGNKRDQVGLCIVYPGGEEKRTYANLLMKMRLVPGVLPEFAVYWIMSPLAVHYIRRHTKGTSPSVQKINQRALINLPFPVGVDIEEQQRWANRMNAIFSKVEEIERRIRDQYEDLQLFPDSILTAAFKGML